jgi:hypothetical protein
MLAAGAARWLTAAPASDRPCQLGFVYALISDSFKLGG